MKYIVRLQAMQDDKTVPHTFHIGLGLERGCGLDVARKHIAEFTDSISRSIEELYKADTEGREPKIIQEAGK